MQKLIAVAALAVMLTGCGAAPSMTGAPMINASALGSLSRSKPFVPANVDQAKIAAGVAAHYTGGIVTSLTVTPGADGAPETFSAVVKTQQHWDDTGTVTFTHTVTGSYDPINKVVETFKEVGCTPGC